MKRAGQIVLFRFPQADLQEGKLRPALLLGKLPGEHGDWLICMISSQARHYVPEFDEIVSEEDSDFASSGLKVFHGLLDFRNRLLEVAVNHDETLRCDDKKGGLRFGAHVINVSHDAMRRKLFRSLFFRSVDIALNGLFQR